MHRYLFTFLNLWALVSLGSAQQHSMYQYTVADGLPSNYVYNVEEDHNGYIWAYTENGIAKFDGYTWTTLSAKEGLPGSDVHSLKIDQHGVLWGQTSNGGQFGLKDGSIIMPQESFSSFGNLVFRGEVYHRGYALRALDSAGNTYLTLPSDEVSKGTTIVQINDSISYCVKLANSRAHKVAIITKGQEKLLLVDQALTANQEVRLISLGGKDYLLVLLQKSAKLYGLYDDEVVTIEYDRSGISYEQFLLSYTTHDGNLRLESDKGCWVFDDRFQLKKSWVDQKFTADYDVHGCRYDQNDNLWVSTRSNGVFLVPSEKLQTKVLTIGEPAANAFEGIIHTENGSIFAANDRGNLAVLQDESLTKILTANKQKVRYSGISYDSENKLVIAHFKTGTIISNLGGLKTSLKNIAPYRYLRARKSEKYAELPLYPLDQARQVLTRSESVFLDSYYGVYLANPDMPFGKHLFSQADTPLRGTYPYYSIAKDSLYQVDATGATSTYFSDLYNVTDLLPLADGQFLIGTEGSGLILFNAETGATKEVLATKFVKRIKTIDNQILVATYSGSYILDESLHQVLHITTLDGLPSDEVNDLTLLNGKLYSATGSGIGITELGHQPASTDTLQDLGISSYLVDGQSSNTLSFLTVGVSTISIKHALTHYASIGQIKYRYRLQPLDDTWSETTSTTTTLYGLEPNDYTFEVQATDAYGGVHIADPVSFTIPRPLNQQLWFRLLVGFMILGGIFNYFRSRDKNRQAIFEKDKDLNSKMADLKLSALRSQMNPHFIFNALGAIQYYVQTHKVEEADRYLTQFAALMRMYLDSSKSTYVTVAEEVKLLNHYLALEQMRFEEIFTYEIMVDRSVDQESTLLPPMITQPFVENSVNHGLPLRTDGNGLINITFSVADDNLKIVISDNGIGVENAKAYKRKNHKSKGMSIVSEKLKTLKESGAAEMELQQKPTSKDPLYPGLQTTLTIKINR